MAVILSLLLTATGKANMDLHASGTLIPPICKVHNGSHGLIDIAFGDDINIDRLDAQNYRKPVNYQIECGSDGQHWQLRLVLKGNAAWNNQTLRSDKDYLGIQFEASGQPMILGQPIPVANSANPPKLSAVLVKQPSQRPDEGSFTATASLQAEYY